MSDIYIALKNGQEVGRGRVLSIREGGVIELHESVWEYAPTDGPRPYLALAPGQWDSVHIERIEE